MSPTSLVREDPGVLKQSIQDPVQHPNHYTLDNSCSNKLSSPYPYGSIASPATGSTVSTSTSTSTLASGSNPDSPLSSIATMDTEVDVMDPADSKCERDTAQDPSRKGLRRSLPDSPDTTPPHHSTINSATQIPSSPSPVRSTSPTLPSFSLPPTSPSAIDDRRSSLASIYGRKPPPRLTESLENISIAESLSVHRTSMASLANGGEVSVGTFGLGSGGAMRVGGGIDGSGRGVSGQSLEKEQEKEQSALARRLSTFSFGRKSSVSVDPTPQAPSAAYRKVSLSAPLTIPASVSLRQSPLAPTPSRLAGVLPPIPQSPQISDSPGPGFATASTNTPFATPLLDGTPRRKSKKYPTMPTHIVIPSRNQSLPSSPGSLGNGNHSRQGSGAQAQLAHPHFKYNGEDNRISIVSDVSGSEQAGVDRLDGTQEDGQRYPAFTIELADIVDPVPSPRKFSDQTFKSEFSLSRGKGAIDDDEGLFSKDQVKGVLDSELEVERYGDIPTPTLIVDSGSSGEAPFGRNRGRDGTPTQEHRNGFGGPPRPDWLQVGHQYSSGQTIAMRSASEDDTTLGSPSRLGLGISSGELDRMSTGRRRRRQSWQALKEVEFQERHQEEKALVEARKRTKRFKLRPPPNERNNSEDGPEASGSNKVGMREAMKQRREKKKVEKQRFIDECDVPPSTSDLFDVSLMEVLDVEGNAVRFGEVVRGGAGRKTVVIFIRHWYCPLCGEYVDKIVRDVSAEALEAANVDLVIVGHGSAKMLPAYSKAMRCPFRMYTDPKLAVYKGLGMTLKTSDAGKEEDKGDYIERGVLTGNWEVAKRATKMPMRNPGHFFQLGGEFIFKDSLHCEWAHRMTTTRNHASIMTILEVAGVVNPEVAAVPLPGDLSAAPPLHAEAPDQAGDDLNFGNWGENGIQFTPAERYAQEERKRSAGQEWLVERETELERIRLERGERRARMEERGLSGCDSLVELDQIEGDDVPGNGAAEETGRAQSRTLAVTNL